MDGEPGRAGRRPQPPSFRVRLTVALIVTAVVPVAAFGVVATALHLTNGEPFRELLLLAVALAAVAALSVAWVLAAQLTNPLRRIATAVERVAAGEPGPRVPVVGDDELARLAESHNRVAAAAQRRNAELSKLLEAVCEYSPEQGQDALVAHAAADARRIFGFIDTELRLADPASVEPEERVPGDPLPVRAVVRAGSDALGVLSGHLPATSLWQPADQDLLELFASEVGVALRNAELFARVDQQNVRLRELDAAKDEFLRGVSHNLQTPLTSIRAYVDQLLAAAPEPAAAHRLGIVAEQTDRLTRLVRQLLTVTRIEANALRSAPDVFALAPRVRRAWEALGSHGVGLELRDESNGWLAVVDPDQLDQILWALLDNAVKYAGTAGPITTTIRVDDAGSCLRLTIADSGPGVPPDDRERLFGRFSRGTSQASGGGTGLGLYVSRGLARAMGGDLRLDPAGGSGASFTLTVPGEAPEDES